MSQEKVTYKHLIAGSVVHFQKKRANKDADAEPIRTLTFHGKKGGVGFYTTSDADEIAELDKLAANPQVQIERDTAEIPEAAAHVMTKAAPAEIIQAVVEVQERAAVVASPEATAAAEKLAGIIAASKK